jgi:hypothetical protein
MGVFESDEPHEPWGAYGFALAHKHLPEMQCFSGLTVLRVRGRVRVRLRVGGKGQAQG